MSAFNTDKQFFWFGVSVLLPLTCKKPQGLRSSYTVSVDVDERQNSFRYRQSEGIFLIQLLSMVTGAAGQPGRHVAVLVGSEANQEEGHVTTPFPDIMENLVKAARTERRCASSNPVVSVS